MGEFLTDYSNAIEYDIVWNVELEVRNEIDWRAMEFCHQFFHRENILSINSKILNSTLQILQNG